MNFESLGDNCEFGLVQRYAGAEPLGLYRFNWAPFASLIAALKNRFEDVGQPENVEIYWQPNEFMVRETQYKFQYHTWLFDATLDTAKLHDDQVRYIAFLKRKLLDELEEGTKIFVRKGNDSNIESNIHQLFLLLRSYGPNTLLWVVRADAQHPSGTVEVLENGLFKGYIDRLSDYENAMDVSLGPWIEVCRKAYSLHQFGVILDPHPPAITNAVTGADNFGGWNGSPVATAEFSWAVPLLRSGALVMAHTFIKEPEVNQEAYGYRISDGLEPGKIYVISVWVWVPDRFIGRSVSVGFHGVSRLYEVAANLSVRGAWQRIWGSARMPNERQVAYPCLYVLAKPGAIVYSTCWKVEPGILPIQD